MDLKKILSLVLIITITVCIAPFYTTTVLSKTTENKDEASFITEVINNNIINANKKISGALEIAVMNNTPSKRYAVVVLKIYDSKNKIAYIKINEATLECGRNRMNFDNINISNTKSLDYSAIISVCEKDDEKDRLAEDLKIDLLSYNDYEVAVFEKQTTGIRDNQKIINIYYSSGHQSGMVKQAFENSLDTQGMINNKSKLVAGDTFLYSTRSGDIIDIFVLFSPDVSDPLKTGKKMANMLTVNNLNRHEWSVETLDGKRASTHSSIAFGLIADSAPAPGGFSIKLTGDNSVSDGVLSYGAGKSTMYKVTPSTNIFIYDAKKTGDKRVSLADMSHIQSSQFVNLSNKNSVILDKNDEYHYAFIKLLDDKITNMVLVTY